MKAILLAAGMGNRLLPLTKNIPKALLPVNGQPLIERQIEMLKTIGINEIIVVTGYLNNAFQYLKNKYNVKLIYNEKYAEYNNIYTMYLVKEYLADAYVIDADVYLNRNFLINPLKHSTYFTGKKESTNEWRLHWDKNKKVYNITVESGHNYIMSGISYWNKKDAAVIVKKLEEKIKILLSRNKGKKLVNNLYWDHIVKENLNLLNVHAKQINTTDWSEIDSIDDLNKLEKYLTEESIAG